MSEFTNANTDVVLRVKHVEWVTIDGITQPEANPLELFLPHSLPAHEAKELSAFLCVYGIDIDFSSMSNDYVDVAYTAENRKHILPTGTFITVSADREVTFVYGAKSVAFADPIEVGGKRSISVEF